MQIYALTSFGAERPLAAAGVADVDEVNARGSVHR